MGRRLSALFALSMLTVFVAPVAVPANVGDATRVAGDTRIDTAVDIARDA